MITTLELSDGRQIEVQNFNSSLSCYGMLVFDTNRQHVLTITTHRGVIGFPKGKRKPLESPIDCAIRELEEETGFQAQYLNTINQPTEMIIENSHNGRPSIGLIQLVAKSTAPPPTPQDTNELVSAQWMNAQQLCAHAAVCRKQGRAQVLLYVADLLRNY